MTALMGDVVSLASGGLVGFSLGLIGGGGSILAVPLLVYAVGVSAPHVAIGTSALAVGANAAVNLLTHARAQTVKWRCAGVFAAAGILGAALGARIGQMVDGQKLLALFSLVMFATAIAMFRGRSQSGDADVMLTRQSAPRLLPRLLPIGVGVGLLAGFFGIGGGFLIVPGLMLATGMPILYAVSSSLVAVSALGFTTASSYALAGLIDWRLAALFLAGGALGGIAGALTAQRLGRKRKLLSRLFAVVIFAVGGYMLVRGFNALV
ncbi:MAG TPA: sulfite exporter TauE/SafE family protein [Hyphomicrobiales bacterium]|nr:sulfite exporter TauE/SafE family protein [Hyphomicrobiales bacterium]